MRAAFGRGAPKLGGGRYGLRERIAKLLWVLSRANRAIPVLGPPWHNRFANAGFFETSQLRCAGK